jgi:hypothetical protein
MNMGRQFMLALVLSVFFNGAFATCYAVAGSVLRGQSWKVIVPIFIVHNVVMNLLYRLLPVLPQPVQMDAAAIARMHERLLFSASALILAMSLGYVCFLYV